MSTSRKNSEGWVLTSNAFRATSFSLALVAALLFDGCAASDETTSYSNSCYYIYVTTRSSWPEFDTDLYYTADSSGQRLDVYISLKESRLKYERTGDKYRASYTATVRVDRGDEQPLVKEVQRVVNKPSYPTASDSSYDAFVLSFRVTPGDYVVEVTLTDEASGQKASREFDKTIPDISNQLFSMSDILLLARFDLLAQGRRITPFILSNAGLLPDTLSFFTVLSSQAPSRDSVFFNMYKLEGQERLPSSYGRSSLMGIGPGFDPCHVGVDTVLVYSFPIRVLLSGGFSYIFGGVPKPSPGNYILEVVAKDANGNYASSILPFRIRGKYFPDITQDLPDMVSSLGYIASKSEMQQIIEVKTDSAVKANLLKFWSDNGGYLKMAEYYQRVSQANRFFSTCLDGWKTPMGMMYIICGPPDYVDCRGSFSERWMYIKTSTDDRVVADFRLTRATKSPADRYYTMDHLYSNLDFWSYYVSRWRTPY
jgi:GWxTD domain-containing protein